MNPRDPSRNLTWNGYFLGSIGREKCPIIFPYLDALMRYKLYVAVMFCFGQADDISEFDAANLIGPEAEADIGAGVGSMELSDEDSFPGDASFHAAGSDLPADLNGSDGGSLPGEAEGSQSLGSESDVEVRAATGSHGPTRRDAIALVLPKVIKFIRKRRAFDVGAADDTTKLLLTREALKKISKKKLKYKIWGLRRKPYKARYNVEKAIVNLYWADVVEGVNR